MGLLSNKISREELIPGDHIYSYRAAYIYAHHGIYIGDDMVIHFTRAASQEIGSGSFLDRILLRSSPTPTDTTICERCGYHCNLGGVIKSCIDCFLAGGNLYIFEYDVSLLYFIAKLRGGSCTLASQDPASHAVRRAKVFLDKGFDTYNIFKNNCEDFAIYCKTGLYIETINNKTCLDIETIDSKGKRCQILLWTSFARGVIFLPISLIYIMGIVYKLVLVGAALIVYSLYRIGKDASFRRVPLEALLARAGAVEPPRASELEIV